MEKAYRQFALNCREIGVMPKCRKLMHNPVYPLPSCWR